MYEIGDIMADKDFSSFQAIGLDHVDKKAGRVIGATEKAIKIFVRYNLYVFIKLYLLIRIKILISWCIFLDFFRNISIPFELLKII